MPITPEISAKMLELKEQSGLNYEQIGAEVGTSDSNARRYIRGETKTPDRKLLFEIVRTIGGDPEELFAPKPLPGLPAPSGMDYALYDRMVSNMESRYASQERLHQESLAKWHERHEKELSSLRASMDQALQSKDEWISRLRKERNDALEVVKESKTRIRTLRTVSIVLGLLVLFFILAYIIPDILRNDFGYLRDWMKS